VKPVKEPTQKTKSAPKAAAVKATPAPAVFGQKGGKSQIVVITGLAPNLTESKLRKEVCSATTSPLSPLSPPSPPSPHSSLNPTYPADPTSPTNPTLTL
jgi:hypothetical protein